MKLIATTAIAIALSAFGARAQTTTTDSSSTTVNPAAPSSGTAATGEDKGTSATAPTGAPGDTTSGEVTPKTTNGISGSTSKDTSSSSDESTTTTIKKHHKKLHKVNKPQGRSDTSGMHRKGDTGASGSVQRPAAPGTTTPDDGTTTAPKDPGMSKPGDVTGQPTDTQKPIDQSGSPPDKK